MAAYEAGVNSPEARKAWSKIIAYEALKRTKIQQFIGSDNDSLIQEHTDLKGEKGDRVRVPLQMQMQSRGVIGDSTLEGQEEAIEIFTDDVVVNQLRHAAKSKGKMSEQRVPFNVRERLSTGLADWWSDRIDTAAFLHLAGYTATDAATAAVPYAGNDVAYTGLNATLAPTSGFHRFAATASTDEDLATTTGTLTMNLSLIDDMVADAKTKTPQIKPVKIGGEDFFVLFLHPYQVRDLRKDASTAGNWIDIQKAAMQGGNVADNPIFTGALGVYNGVVLHESTRVPLGVDSTANTRIDTVRRAIFAGAQAGVIAFADGCSMENWDWVEEMFDYENQFGVSAGCIHGLKKSRYNGKDFAAMVLSTRAVA